MKKYLLLFIIPVLAFASEAHGGPKNFDVVWRTINFIIFFGILFYILKGPAKAAYKARIDGIASRLEANKRILEESNERKERAKKDLEEAKIQGAALIETAKKEAVFATEKIKSAADQELSNLQRSFDEQKDAEVRRVKKEVVSEILDEIFTDKTVEFGQNKLLDIVEKKAV